MRARIFRAFTPKQAVTGFFGTLTTSYLIHDFHFHPKNDFEPIKSKKIFFPADKLFKVKRYTSDELSQRELVIRNGLAYHANSSTPLSGNNWIYVLDKDGKIYVDEQKRRVVNHTSLGHSLNVISAGEIRIIDGQIVKLNEKSGHFRPKKRSQLAENNLKGKGATFHSEFKCEDFSAINSPFTIPMKLSA